MRSSLVPDVHPCVRQCADVFDDLVTEREGLPNGKDIVTTSPTRGQHGRLLGQDLDDVVAGRQRDSPFYYTSPQGKQA
jgi:hypothetical protein